MPIDMTGKTYGKLTAIRRVENGPEGKPWYLFLCGYCGQKKPRSGSNVRNGSIISCGCRKLARGSNSRIFKHGHASGAGGKQRTPEYRAWRAMIGRCYDKRNIGYANYGARGIMVCKRWRHSFSNFFADMGPKPPRTTVERKNNNLGYSPSNCEWATTAEQGRNRRNNHRITHNGETMILTDWAKRAGMSRRTLSHRINDEKLPFGEAIARPVGWRKIKQMETP